MNPFRGWQKLSRDDGAGNEIVQMTWLTFVLRVGFFHWWVVIGW